jgi:predicted helicase
MNLKHYIKTLEEAHDFPSLPLFGQMIAKESQEAGQIKQDAPVMVILGNPPYSYESSNRGDWISAIIREYYQVDGQPLGERNPKGLQDDYVKFIRFAQWRIEQTGYGILGFVTNHGYLDNPTFRGMRQSLMNTFDKIYLLDLHGNSKKKETATDGSKDENVFDIQQGVAICLMVKTQS